MTKHLFSVKQSVLSNVLLNKETIWDNYLYQGHPEINIPGFDSYDADVILSDFMDKVEDWGSCIESNGSEFDTEYTVNEDGLVAIKYLSYGLEFEDKGAFDEIHFLLTGYIHETEEDYFVFSLTSLEIVSLQNHDG